MPRLQRKSVAFPAEVRDPPLTRVEIFTLDDVVIGRMRMEPGWRWSTHVRPVAGTDRCRYHHVGVCTSGRLHVQMPDGEELEIGPDTVFEIPPGHDAWVVGDEPWVAWDFAGTRSYARPTGEGGERVLAAILFTDIVESTAALERMGDEAWRELLAQHNQRARYEVDRFRGREVASTGDGLLILFDGSERAVRCAASIRDATTQLGIEIRVGIHTGEVEIVTGALRGVAAHVAARILALARPGEVLVSDTTRDLLSGSSLEFEPRGTHELKGLSAARSVYALKI